MDQHIAPLIAVLFIALIVVAVLGAVLRALKGPSAYPYERSDKLFSPAERSFLGVLEQIFGNEFRILGKVRLGDIIRVRKGLSKSAWATANNRIDRRHVDLAICDPRTLQVIGIIELDDSSHKSAARQRGDEFKDKALAAAGVPILRIPAQRSYSPDEIRERVSVLFEVNQ